jgi:hypothetical protein
MPSLRAGHQSRKIAFVSFLRGFPCPQFWSFVFLFFFPPLAPETRYAGTCLNGSGLLQLDDFTTLTDYNLTELIQFPSFDINASFTFSELDQMDAYSETFTVQDLGFPQVRFSLFFLASLSLLLSPLLCDQPPLIFWLSFPSRPVPSRPSFPPSLSLSSLSLFLFLCGSVTSTICGTASTVMRTRT